MFYSLKYGEKPPNKDIRPMQPRGTDNRSHIFTQHPTKPDVVKNCATSDWATFGRRYADPAAPPPVTDGGAEVQNQHTSDSRDVVKGTLSSSPLWKAQQLKRDVPTKVSAVEHPTEAPVRVRAKHSMESPFAVGDARVGAFGKSSASYGVPGPAARLQPPAAAGVPYDVKPVPPIPAGVTAQDVVGTFARVDGEPPKDWLAELEGPKKPPPLLPAMLTPEAMAARMATTVDMPKPSSAGAVPGQQQGQRLTSNTLQNLDTWRYRHQTGTLPSSVVAAPGPQVGRWVQVQQELDELEGPRRAPSEIGSVAPSAAAVPPPPASAPPQQQQQQQEAVLPVGTQLVMLPNGRFCVVGNKATVTGAAVRPTTGAGTVLPTGPQLNPSKLGLGAKPLSAAVPTTTATAPPLSAEQILKARFGPESGNVPRDTVVVQSVGGPPPTSIAAKTLAIIRKEREAHLRARWLVDAPARAEALQRRVDEILLSLRRSVEAKGFSEPTKGAQFVIKTCRQHTSTPNEEMTFEGFREVLEKGFSLTLPDDVLESLFERIDLSETSVAAFRTFGEVVFQLTPSEDTERGRLQRAANGITSPHVRTLLETIKSKIAQRHAESDGWMAAFSSAFRNLHKLAGTNVRGTAGAVRTSVNAKELQAALVTLGIHTISLRDCTDIVKALDVNRNGEIDEQEFLTAMRGPMRRSRRALVFQAFSILDADKSGCVSISELSARYRADQHPRVLTGETTAEAILKEFAAVWKSPNTPVGKPAAPAATLITWFEFLDYYKNISAAIENEDYFELMMRNCWHMSGGTGAAENTTCRRVLVIFHDKSQKVIELENDLGIGPKDMDKMRAQLEKQGVKNIERIELYG